VFLHMLHTGLRPTTQLSYLRARIQRMELVHSGTKQHLFLSNTTIFMAPLHKSQHQLMRVIMYLPFSRSYIIFVLGFFHLNTKNTPQAKNPPSTTSRGIWLCTLLAGAPDGPRIVLLVFVMNAPRAHSTWVSPTWFEYLILLRENCKKKP
jgi:hypothetical protein